MKKFVSILLCFCMVVGLCACGNKQNKEEPANTSVPETTEVETEIETDLVTEVVAEPNIEQTKSSEVTEETFPVSADADEFTIPVISEAILSPVKDITSDDETVKSSIQYLENYLKENVDGEYQIVDFDDTYVHPINGNADFSQVIYNVRIDDKNYQFVHNISDNLLVTDYGKVDLYKKVKQYLFNKFPKINDDEKFEQINISVYTTDGLFFAEDKTVDDILNRVDNETLSMNDYNIDLEGFYHGANKEDFSDKYLDTLKELAKYDGNFSVRLCNEKENENSSEFEEITDEYNISLFYVISGHEIECYDEISEEITKIA